MADATSSAKHQVAATETSRTSTSGPPRVTQRAKAQAAKARATANPPRFVDQADGIIGLIVERDESRNRLAVPRDRELLASLDAFEQGRQVGWSRLLAFWRLLARRAGALSKGHCALATLLYTLQFWS